MATQVLRGQLVAVPPRRRRRASKKPVVHRRKSSLHMVGKPNGGRILRVAVGLLAGKVIRSRIDIPWVSEEALGVLLISLVSKQAGEKAIALDIAIALQAVEVADRAGVVAMLSNIGAGASSGG
jgi:hypothetical protein